MGFSVKRDLWKDYWVLWQERYFSRGLSNASRRGVMSGRGLVLSTRPPSQIFRRAEKRASCSANDEALSQVIMSVDAWIRSEAFHIFSLESQFTDQERNWVVVDAYAGLLYPVVFSVCLLTIFRLGRGISFPWCVNSKMAASLQVTESIHFLLLKSWLLSRTVTRS